jgi:CBS domain-containing protein
MTYCPACGAQFIEGDDNCEQCGLPLSDLSLAEPASEVERSLLSDRVGVLGRHRDPVTLAPSATVGETLKQLVGSDTGAALIVDGGKLVGIFTERDALLKFGVDVKDFVERPISEFMTVSPQTLLDSGKIAFAVHQMDVGSYRHMPIVDSNGAVESVISVRDILQYFANKMAAK